MFEKVSFMQWTEAMANSGMEDDTIEEIYSNIIIPKRGTVGSAGYDFYCPFKIEVKPEQKYIVPTGIKCDMSNINFGKGEHEIEGSAEHGLRITENFDYIPQACALLMYPRSSLGFKFGMKMMNTVPVIDADYYDNQDNEGHIFVAFKADRNFTIMPGDKFCQGILTTVGIFNDEEIPTATRMGGIGSTGA